MSSQVKLTLRPPPNVDFVNGYPGIPPGAPDRPQAAVKGAIEVRTSPAGVKAKWVRIELRKVETLPGSHSNIFYDFVGPSPVNLWTASDEYGLLKSLDFPFQIRIPESIPPSVTLDHGVGIKYELLASVCTKGKRGFFRRRKSSVVSTQAYITIDKHELHSTWPIYCQPEARQISQDGVTLVVERNQTCYGPGDRVTVLATLKSDSPHTIILRGFELTLKEQMIFRAGPYASGKKTSPDVRVTIVSENKFVVNNNLYGGNSHRAELTCNISPNHTTTSLNTARHIDINYVLSVKAQLGQGNPVVVDLPVIVSNWQRVVSIEAVKRIGPTPNLSLLPLHATSPNKPIMQVEPFNNNSRMNPGISPSPSTFGGRSADPYGRNTPLASANTYNGGSSVLSKPDEFGYGSGGHKSTLSQSNEMPPARRRSARPGSSGEKKFTVANAIGGEIPEEGRTRRPSAGGSSSGAGAAASAPAKQWLTAEEEKAKLYEEARAKAERAQGIVAKPIATEVATSPITQPKPKAGAAQAKWLTAEQEKMRLFNNAQAAVRKTQGGEAIPTSSSPVPSLDRGLSASATPSSSNGGGASTVRTKSVPTAEQEKAALKRYYEAKRAVDRTLNAGIDEEGGTNPALGIKTNGLAGPVAYDALYPSTPSGGSGSGSRNNIPTKIAVDSADLPPPFEASTGVMDAQTQLNEKVRMRKVYEAQEAAARRGVNGNTNGTGESPPYGNPPPFDGGGGGFAGLNGISGISGIVSEKEMLRRRLEAQDAEALAAQRQPQPPARVASPISATRGTRPTPAPPAVSPSGSKILSALEEKAMLKARYDAEDAASPRTPTPKLPKPNGNGNTNGYSPLPSSTFSSPSPPPPVSPGDFGLATPPPLMPRPPVEYIQETQEEDARVSRFAIEGVVPLDDGLVAGDVGKLGGIIKAPGPPPPLPPKPLED